MNPQVEQWRAIADYPDYEVSDQGRVRRTSTRTSAKAGTILKTPLRGGYPCVDLCRPGEKKRTYHVHRLVAAAFLGPSPVGHEREVNHINAVKSDNRATNLEYVTSSENSLHAFRLGLQDCSGEKNGQAKLTEAQVREIKQILARRRIGESYAAIGKRFGVTGDNIRAIANGRSWKHVEADP